VADEAARSAVTGSSGKVATIVALSAQSFIPRTENSLFRAALPSGPAAKLMNFKHFLIGWSTSN
jgi:hypothetical protein